MVMKKSLRRRIKRLLRKPKFLKVKTTIFEFQKFHAICFIGISKDIDNEKQGIYELFRMGTSLAAEHFYKFLDWFFSWFPKVTGPLISLFKNNRYLIIFGIGISFSLLIFREQMKIINNSVLSWLKEKFKGTGIGCSIILILLIYLCLICVTDLPVLPLRKIIRYFIFKISKSNDGREKGQLILFSVITVLFTRYLLVEYKHRWFESLPFGGILREMYQKDMKKRLSRSNTARTVCSRLIKDFRI
jgi:hypothetical protein